MHWSYIFLAQTHRYGFFELWITYSPEFCFCCDFFLQLFFYFPPAVAAAISAGKDRARYQRRHHYHLPAVNHHTAHHITNPEHADGTEQSHAHHYHKSASTGNLSAHNME